MEQYERNSWPRPHNMLALKCCIKEQGERNQYAHKVHNAHTHMCMHVTKVYNTKGTPSCSHRVCKMHTIHAKVRQERLVCAHSAHIVRTVCTQYAQNAHIVHTMYLRARGERRLSISLSGAPEQVTGYWLLPKAFTHSACMSAICYYHSRCSQKSSEDHPSYPIPHL